LPSVLSSELSETIRNLGRRQGRPMTRRRRAEVGPSISRFYGITITPIATIPWIAERLWRVCVPSGKPLRIEPMAPCTLDEERPLTMTRAPSTARKRAISRPMPPEDPVTSASWLSSFRFMMVDDEPVEGSKRQAIAPNYSVAGLRYHRAPGPKKLVRKFHPSDPEAIQCGPAMQRKCSAILRTAARWSPENVRTSSFSRPIRSPISATPPAWSPLITAANGSSPMFQEEIAPTPAPAT